MNKKKHNFKKRDNINRKLIFQITFSIMLVIVVICTKQFDNVIAKKIVEFTEKKVTNNLDISPVIETISSGLDRSMENISSFFKGEKEFAAPVNGTINKKYGIAETDNNPYYNHGLDISSNTETVRAISGGKVIIVNNNSKLSNYIVVETEDKKIIYGKLDQFFVEEGDTLKKGDVIGALDINNQILHIEIWEDGESINPEKFFNVDE